MLRRWESAVEQQIRAGMARGEFDALPGKGKPIAGLDSAAEAVRDDDWWLKAKLRAERLSYLPPTIRIRDINRRGAEGPPSTVMVLDVEAEVERWRSIRRA
jgi:hypothetical protein